MTSHRTKGTPSEMTLGGTVDIAQPRGICPVHGEVEGNFHCYSTTDPTYRTPNLCPKCYVDWVGSQVQHVAPKPEVQP